MAIALSRTQAVLWLTDADPLRVKDLKSLESERVAVQSFDPTLGLKQQNCSPHGFDLVVDIHGTVMAPNLLGYCMGLRSLLSSGGQLLMLMHRDIPHQQFLATMTTSGSPPTDPDVRPDGPLVSNETIQQILTDIGMQWIVSHASPLAWDDLVCAVLPKSAYTYSPLREAPEGTPNHSCSVAPRFSTDAPDRRSGANRS